MQPSRDPQDFSAEFDHHVVLFPTRSMPHPTAFPNGHPAPPAGRPAPAPQAPALQKRVRTRAIREVVVLEVEGRLEDVVEDLDRAIQIALAEGPRGVVCDLSRVFEGAEPVALEVLATAGRHVRDWSGIPVAVACPDPRVRAELAAHPLGRHLIVSASMFSAVSSVLATPIPAVGRLPLSPHPTAPRASRNFVTRTLLDWQLGRSIRFASLVVSELVTSSTMNAGTKLEVSIAWNLGVLRLTVRGYAPGTSSAHDSAPVLRGRGLSVVAGLSRVFGVLPTADGGKVVWAVLDAPRPRPLAGRQGPKPAAARQETARVTGVSRPEPRLMDSDPLR